MVEINFHVGFHIRLLFLFFTLFHLKKTVIVNTSPEFLVLFTEHCFFLPFRVDFNTNYLIRLGYWVFATK